MAAKKQGAICLGEDSILTMCLHGSTALDNARAVCPHKVGDVLESKKMTGLTHRHAEIFWVVACLLLIVNIVGSMPTINSLNDKIFEIDTFDPTKFAADFTTGAERQIDFETNMWFDNKIFFLARIYPNVSGNMVIINPEEPRPSRFRN